MLWYFFDWFNAFNANISDLLSASKTKIGIEKECLSSIW
jgi:hypothetical protein